MEIKSFILLSLLIACIQICFAEPKRSFGLARSRPKSNNMSVRRRTHTTNDNPPRQASPPKLPSNTANQGSPQGPPPAYSAGNANAGKTNIKEAPPAYSSHANAPPSYSQATGTGLYGNSPSYPKQTYSGVNSAPNMHQSAPNYGWNTHGNSHMPSYGSAGHAPSYGAGHMPSYGSAGHMPSYGGGHMPSYGGYGSGMPSYGGYGGNGMMGGGMMGGGMMGGGMMGGGMTPYKQKSGLFSGTNIASNVVTGLAVWQLTKAFSGGGGHHSTQHIYHHHDTPPQTVQIAQTAQTQQTDQSASLPASTGVQSNANSNLNSQQSYGQPMPYVPLAPFPNDTSITEKPKCEGENCPEPVNVPDSVTQIPEFSNELSTIHPSLFPYATFSEHLQYWATSHNKVLNLTAPDTTVSSILSTTISS